MLRLVARSADSRGQPRDRRVARSPDGRIADRPADGDGGQHRHHEARPDRVGPPRPNRAHPRGRSPRPQDSSLDESFSQRQYRHSRAKGAIAQAAANLVPAGASLFLNDGSTAFALAQELAQRELKLWIATCALNIAELLARNGAIDVVVIGGSLRRTSFGTVGPLATDAISELHAEIAFLGCDGVHLDAGVRSNSIYDAEIAQTMAANADQTILIADSSKLGNKARSLIVPLEKIDHWITDTLDPKTRRNLARIPTRVTTVWQ